MRTNLNLLHKIVGVTTVLIFVGTGVLMRLHFSVVYEANHLVRMMFRSIHIYILLAGLLNIAIGTYMRLSTEKRKRIAQVFGSICLLAAPAVLIAAFFYEPVRETLERRITQFGVILLLVGTLSHMLGASRTREA
jgi:uncharacterized membrane protein SirB2